MNNRPPGNGYTINDILRRLVWIGIIVILVVYFVKSKQPKQPVQSAKSVSRCYSEPTKYPPYGVVMGYRCYPRSRYIYWGGMDETKASTEQSISDSTNSSKPIPNYGVAIGRIYKKQNGSDRIWRVFMGYPRYPHKYYSDSTNSSKPYSNYGVAIGRFYKKTN